MNKKIEIPDDALSDELKALLAETPPLTPERENELGDSIRNLQSDPAFQADLHKAVIVDRMLEGMEREGLNKNQLATKWGKSRQYVGRILDEDARVNFTLETMCEMLALVGKRLFIDVRDAHAHAAAVQLCPTRDDAVDQSQNTGDDQGREGDLGKSVE